MNAPNHSQDPVPDDLSGLRKSKRSWFRAVWISAIVVVVPLFVGLGGTVFGMLAAFGELGQTGKADPEALAGDISVALLTTMWGLLISFAALVGFVVSLVVFLRKRKALREWEGRNH